MIFPWKPPFSQPEASQMKNLNGFFCRCSIEDALSSQRMPVLVAIIKCLARFPEEKIELGCVQNFMG
jgi:hypothetical protein